MKKYKKGSELKPVPLDTPGLRNVSPDKLRALGYKKKTGGSMGNAMSAVKKGFDQAGAMITSKKAYGGSMDVNKAPEKMLIKAMQAGGPMDMVDVIAMKKGGCMKCGGSMKKLGGAVIMAKTK